jgi:hypothetical protein
MFLRQIEFALNELLCDSRMKETDCQKETEEKGQVATNYDDNHVVSRDIRTRSSKCSRYFFLLQLS